MKEYTSPDHLPSVEPQPDHGPNHLKSLDEVEMGMSVILHLPVRKPVRIGEEDPTQEGRICDMTDCTITIWLQDGRGQLDIGIVEVGLEPHQDGGWSKDWLEQVDD